VDSSVNGFGILQYDRYWVIQYHRIVTVDTTVAPPETTVTYRLDSLAPPPRLVQGQTFETQKDAPWNVKRYVYLRKAGSAYPLRRMSGFSVFLPTTTDAPNISMISLSYQGYTDTFRLGGQQNRKGIYNLRDRDSLYAVIKNTPLGLRINTGKPSLGGDRFYYFARLDTQRILLGKDTTGLTASVVFPNAGLKYLLIEVIPQSNLFYPQREYAIAVWSMPIRVKD
jgi:hypothetical protein